MGYNQLKVQQFKNKHKRNPTIPENDLLGVMRQAGLNVQFQKMVKVGNGFFILDFVIKQKPYAILELDGLSHRGKESYDIWRQNLIVVTKKYRDYQFLRFQNEDVYNGKVMRVLRQMYPFRFL